MFESPVMDGTYDFSAANSYGRAFYKNRVFVISMLIFADNICLLQEKLSEISLWLSGDGVLVFDDMESVEWMDAGYVYNACMNHDPLFCISVSNIRVCIDYLKRQEQQ